MDKKFALHVSNYSIGNILVTISGFISFPIFTRIFSVQEYGVMNLISATLGLLIAFSKLGIQHSIVRFYSEARSGRLGIGVNQYFSTTLVGMAVVSIVVTVVWAAISQLIPTIWWSDPRISGLFLLTAVLLLIRNIDSCLINFLRAEEKSGLLSLYTVVKRYGTLGLVLLTLTWIAQDLFSYFWATIIGETIAVAVLFALLYRTHNFSLNQFSPKPFRRMLAFGIPMIAYELSGNLLNTGDRYVIEGMLGTRQLGVYSAAYNFCQYVQAVFLMSIGQAVFPMYMRYWEEKGEAETKRFIQQTLHYYLLIALPIVAGVSVIGEQMLTLLASEKYADGAIIIPYVVGGMAIESMLGIVAPGLYIHKRTIVMAGYMVLSAILNILLNIWLVPKLGILGAGIATLISYGVLTAGAMVASNRLLAISFPWASASKFIFLSVIMYAAAASVSVANPWANIVLRTSLGIFLYATLVLMFDKQTRAVVRKGLFGSVQQLGSVQLYQAGSSLDFADNAVLKTLKEITPIKKVFKRAVASSVIWPLASQYFKEPGVTVITYHRITQSDSSFSGCDVKLFRQQMQWLHRHCMPIGPDQFMQNLARPSVSRPPVLVTFDDGYRDYFDLAYPILEEYSIPAVVFLATAFIDSGGMIWTDEVTWAVSEAEARIIRLPWSELKTFDLTRTEERIRLREEAKMYLKGISNDQRKQLLERLYKELRVSTAKANLGRQMLNWDEVRATLKLTSYGGHSHTHPIMSQLDEVEMEKEISTCRDRILTETCLEPRYFAYPNGRPQDFNETTKHLLKQYGFDLAFSTVIGNNTRDMDPMSIKRVHHGDSSADLAALVAGMHRH